MRKCKGSAEFSGSRRPGKKIARKVAKLEEQLEQARIARERAQLRFGWQEVATILSFDVGA